MDKYFQTNHNYVGKDNWNKMIAQENCSIHIIRGGSQYFPLSVLHTIIFILFFLVNAGFYDEGLKFVWLVLSKCLKISPGVFSKDPFIIISLVTIKD